MPSARHSAQFAKLYEIVTQLRNPDGCPWDQKQSPDSITKYLLEEANELADAISHGDNRHISEEIGDLLFILFLLMRMYEEEGQFAPHDVVSGIIGKMVRRHPHVFAGMETGSEQELKEQWEAIKAQEKKST